MIDPGARAAVWWVAVAVIFLVLVMLALRGYHSPSVLIDFANMKLCARVAGVG